MATATLAHQLDSLLIGSLKNQLATDSYKLRANLQCFHRQPHEQKKDNLRPLQASRCSPVPIRNRDSRSYATVLRQEFQRNLLEWRRVHGDHVKSEAVEKAITQILKEAEEMRSRAKKLGETTRKAVE
uniref:Uncharacterized protein n=1 Tax=Populus alba TaxID=43335 RepID=A0A4V6A587_POPAL|nr:hypothetical protein D5086_0000238640 [Populus alba]